MLGRGMWRGTGTDTGPRWTARIGTLVVIGALVGGCGDEEVAAPDPAPAPDPTPAPGPPAPDPGPPNPDIYRIPVVVHVIHRGEPVGTGYNHSVARIAAQIRVLNEDYRRKAGTPGHNEHPDGGDARIEFVLARVAPDGSATDGIVRIDETTADNPIDPAYQFDFYAHYSYWPPDRYLNVWSIPLPGAEDVVLGLATGPETDLPGAERLTPGEPIQAEGVLVNAAHFGPSDYPSEYNRGRTLTPEIGHYLGLLHTWAGYDCESDDYCADTPPADFAIGGCPSTPPLGCDGTPVMIENYMNFSFDRCMNTFTNDQIARMRYVLENSPRRTSLVTSPGLGD